MTLLDLHAVTTYPGQRAADRPLDPPPTIQGLLGSARAVPVEIEYGRHAWLICNYDDVRALMADPRISANQSSPGFPSEVMGVEPMPGFFLGNDNPDHARLRRAVTKPFLVKNVETLRPAIQRTIDDLIDAMLARGNEADLMRDFCLPLPSLVISEMLGVDYDDHEFFQENSVKILSHTVDDPTAPLMAMQALGQFMVGLFMKRMEEPSDDLATSIAEQIKLGSMSVEESAGVGMLLLLGGHDTTANQIALSTIALLEHPDQLALLQADDNDAVAVTAVEELMRYLTIPHTGRRRQALEDIQLGDVTIEAGDGVVFATDIANRDPDVFPDPDALDITRDASAHVGFSYGPHQCLGQTLARIELHEVYKRLYRRIPTLRLAAPMSELDYKFVANIYGVNALPVTW